MEKQNNINVNIFGRNKTRFPIYIPKERYNDVLNLLLIKDHYALINDFNRFMYKQTNHKEKKHFCVYCLQWFNNENYG